LCDACYLYVQLERRAELRRLSVEYESKRTLLEETFALKVSETFRIPLVWTGTLFLRAGSS
jgi:hypothetical protein